ncbi:MAG: hypothetical protein LBO72_04660 [Helicobacteraceae bacterium]|nr:hypothetical protein [Helicobacteraceae bacterium]
MSLTAIGMQGRRDRRQSIRGQAKNLRRSQEQSDQGMQARSGQSAKVKSIKATILSATCAQIDAINAKEPMGLFAIRLQARSEQCAKAKSAKTMILSAESA